MGVGGSSAGLRYIILPQATPEAVITSFGGYLSRGGSRTTPTGDFTLFHSLIQRLRGYFEGEVVEFPDKLDLKDATPFQRRVWEVTRSIPYGERRSYQWVAQQIGMPQAARAVGQALANNPLPILVPCHRVIASDGDLGGFKGGRGLKGYLVELEASLNLRLQAKIDCPDGYKGCPKDEGQPETYELGKESPQRWSRHPA